MEISSYSTSNLLQTMNSNSREFEFQKMSSSTLDHKDHSTSPADELFYNGKLLPLHLPPRFQMVDKILRNSSSFCSSAATTHKDTFFDQEFYNTPLMTTTAPTPYDSCNISPFDSCPVSRELNPDEYMAEYSSDVNSGYLGGDQNPKRSSSSWTKKLKLMKSSGLGSKLKAWFGKSAGCSDESSCKSAAKVADEGTLSKACNEGHFKAGKKAPFGQIQALTVVNKQKTAEDRLHRRSFSLAIKWNSSATKSNSSSSSSSSLSGSSSSSSTSSLSSASSSSGVPFLKRSTSTTVMRTEAENPIQGAIAHCKLSQEAIC
ncbi:Probable membrane-associated kinase regulator 4 [Linum grandiflorum]